MYQIVVVMFLWAICFPLITLGIDYAPHLTFATLRAMLAGITLLGIAKLLKRPPPKDKKTWLMLALIGLGATTFGFFGMFHAAEFISPGIATVIANTQPLMAALLASIFLKEQLGKRGAIGILLGFIGIVMISAQQMITSNTDTYITGIIYIFLAAIGITVSNVLIRYMSGKVDALWAMGWQLILGSVPLGLLALYTESPTEIIWSGEFIISLLGLALPGTALVYLLWFNILEKVELSRANIFTFLAPIFGLTMGFIFYGERLSLLMLTGALVTIVGIIYMNLQKPSKLQEISNATRS